MMTRELICGSSVVTKLAAGIYLLGAPSSPGALVSVYQFNGNFNDSLGNGNPAQGSDGPLLPDNANGSSFASGTWTWSASDFPGSGLLLDVSPSLAGNYSIGIRFKFEDVASYRKLVDFKNGASDNGVYVLNNTLNFYPAAASANVSIAANTFVDVLLIRAGANNGVTGHLNGNAVAEWKFTDTNSLAVAETVGNAARFRFFQDDTLTLGEFSNGSVAEIRLWDAPLTASEIPTAFADIPEPGVLVFFGAALAGGALHRRRSGKGSRLRACFR